MKRGIKLCIDISASGESVEFFRVGEFAPRHLSLVASLIYRKNSWRTISPSRALSLSLPLFLSVFIYVPRIVHKRARVRHVWSRGLCRAQSLQERAYLNVRGHS